MEEEVKQLKTLSGVNKTGEFIKQLRLSHNLTQEQLSSKIYVTRKAVSKWETGQCYPSIDVMLNIANVFGITFDELLAGEFKDPKEKVNDVNNIRFVIKFVKNKYINRMIIIAILFSIFVLTQFFIENYNATKIYSVAADNNGLHVKNGSIIETRGKTYINIGQIYNDFDDTNEDTEFTYTLYTKNGETENELLKYKLNNNFSYNASNNYEELSNFNAKNKYDKLYINVKYINKERIEKNESVKLSIYLYYQNRDYYNFKNRNENMLFNNNQNYDLKEDLGENETNRIDNIVIDLKELFEIKNNKLIELCKKKFNNELLCTASESIIKIKLETSDIYIDKKNKIIEYKNDNDNYPKIYKANDKYEINFQSDNELYRLFRLLKDSIS